MLNVYDKERGLILGEYKDTVEAQVYSDDSMLVYPYNGSTHLTEKGCVRVAILVRYRTLTGMDIATDYDKCIIA